LLFAIFFYIAMILALVLAFCMTLAFMFTLGVLALMLAVCALTFVLAIGTLTLVLAFGMTLAFMFTFGVLALMFAVCALTFVLAGSLTLALVLAFSVLALVLAFLGSMTTSSRILATSGQFLTCSGIGLYSISIITYFADFFAQLVRICLLGIVIDRDLRRIGIIGIIFHTFEERNVIFETVNAFLAFQGSVGLDGYALHLCISTQSNYGHQGHQNKFFHFYVLLIIDFLIQKTLQQTVNLFES